VSDSRVRSFRLKERSLSLTDEGEAGGLERKELSANKNFPWCANNAET
jgi:hypothetical protein